MIRIMKQEDLLQAAALEKICFKDPWSYSILEIGLGRPYDIFFVLEADGIIGGYCNFRTIAGEGEIQRIAVLPTLRGQGFGKKLMETMVLFARKQEVTEVSLEVRASNQTAINLYKSYGFREEAVRKDYYRNPTEDAIIMWNRGI